MQGKQAKVLSPTQERAIVGYLDTTRYPARDRVIFLLSIKAGLRAKEIGCVPPSTHGALNKVSRLMMLMMLMVVGASRDIMPKAAF